ncbi:MAG: hypothetical protein ABI877_21100 [Gemmatimonadaceae bacterium]
MTHPASSTAAKALGGAIASVLDAPTQVAAALAGALTKGSSCGCEIPPPCWEPQPAGTCCLELTPGGSATIRVHVSNCGWNRQLVSITALGKIAGWMSFSPTTLILDPIERATILVTVHLPNGLNPGDRLSGPIIIRGCRDHYARVEVTVADCAGKNTCDVVVDDCPDNIHHWYDHFYCPRPCRNARTPGTKGVNDG